MEINQLKYFKAVAETGKVILAAEQLFVTPSAISASLSSLEKELGVQLFVRKRNQLLLNRQGRILLDYAEHILRYVADAQTDIVESLSEAPNHIVVGVTSSNLWTEMLAEFALTHPEIALTSASINVKDINNAGLNSRFSFLLAAEGDAPEDYEKNSESIYLFDDTPVVMVSPEHPLAQKDVIEPEDLAGLPLIWPRANNNIYRKIRRIFENRDLPMPAFSSHTQLASLLLVKKNVSIALTTAHFQNSFTEELRSIPLNVPECCWPHRLYWRKKHTLTPEELCFVEFVKKFYE